MASSEREDSYYHPTGIPITPQARQFGFEFPVYVSPYVWKHMCSSNGIRASKGVTTDSRITRLLQHAYEGLGKKLAATDDFLYYNFKGWYWDKAKPKAKKMSRLLLGARLFLDPSTDGPWMYIFEPYIDSLDRLEQKPVNKKGEQDEKDFITFEPASFDGSSS